MKTIKSSLSIAALSGFLFASTAFAGAKTNGVRINQIYINPLGTAVLIYIVGSAAVNPMDASCGSTFNGEYVYLSLDYATDAKREGMKQAFNMLMSAYLSGKPISFFSNGCAPDLWGGASKRAVIYDLSI